MLNRRDILKQSCALALGAVAHSVRAEQGVLSSPGSGERGVDIRSVVRRDETILRLGGMGDGYKMTWEAEDRLYLVVNDGPGWVAEPRAFYNARLWTVSGDIREPEFSPVRGYPALDIISRPEGAPSYYGHGVLAAEGRLYHFLSTLDQATERPRHWTGSKLIYSDDNGRTWRNQDGTTPVVWEDRDMQSRERLAFFQEPDGSFSLLSILQMGPGYTANRDGYIYVAQRQRRWTDERAGNVPGPGRRAAEPACL